LPLDVMTSLCVHLDNGDPLHGPCTCLLSRSADAAQETTRCGLVAESLLTELFLGTTDAGEATLLHRLDLDKLDSLMCKDIVCKVVWMIWEKHVFEESQISGNYVAPYLEHTYLIDLASARTGSSAYLIQAAFGLFHSSVAPISDSYLWKHLEYLEKFDRKTVLSGKLLRQWILDSNFIEFPESCRGLQQLEGKEFYGMTTFTGYAYDKEEAAKRVQVLRNATDCVSWRDLKAEISQWKTGRGEHVKTVTGCTT